jgi:hypothetical protein
MSWGRMGARGQCLSRMSAEADPTTWMSQRLTQRRPSTAARRAGRLLCRAAVSPATIPQGGRQRRRETTGAWMVLTRRRPLVPAKQGSWARGRHPTAPHGLGEVLGRRATAARRKLPSRQPRGHRQ